MPELPEVEVVRRSLQSFIKGLEIKKVSVFNRNLRYKIRRDFEKKIINQKIIFIRRRSKFLLLGLENHSIILIHLGMTGKIFIINNSSKKVFKTSFYYENEINKKHNHIIIKFNKFIKLIYNDVRKFGFVKFFKKENIYLCSHLKKLGPEPLNKKFNFSYFKKFIISRNRTIKDILMDQKFVAGLGNIYVNEILFISRVKPTKKIKSLTDKEIKNIIKFTKKILTKAIVLGGSSIKDFSSTSGKKGSFQQYFSVYGKKGENCPNKNCRENIIKIVLANRATFFCARCQK